jgi:hypothetical protein
MKNFCLIVLGCLLATAAFAAEPTRLPGTNQSGPQPPYDFSKEGSVLYDNGAPDGTNGYSNAVVGAFGARRTLLDDFVVPAAGWNLSGFGWTHVWSSGAGAGTGTSDEFRIVANSGGTPDIGTVIATASPTGYAEVATGNTFFSRPEIASSLTFTPIAIAAGTYWLDHTIVGPENNFHLVRATVTGNELWVNYDDLGGLQSGTTQFGVAADLNFVLMGELMPVELQSFEVE